MIKLLCLFLVFFFFILLGVFGYTWYRLNEKLDIHAQMWKSKEPLVQNLKTEFVKSQDGKRIAFWYLPIPQAKAVVILVHPFTNPGGKGFMAPYAQFLHEAGYSVAMLDLRSFGESEGHRVMMGVEEWQDVSAVYDNIKAQSENKDKKIGLLGFSLGAVTSLNTVGKTGKGDFIVVSVPYASFQTLFPYQIKKAGLSPTLFYPFMKIAGYFELGLKYEQNTPLRLASNIHVPTFMIAASDDEEVPQGDEQKIYDEIKAPKEFWLAQSTHDVFGKQPEEYKKRVLEFLNKYAQ